MADPNALARSTVDSPTESELRTAELRGGSYSTPTNEEVRAYKKAQRNLKRLAAMTNANNNETSPKEPSPQIVPESRPQDVLPVSRVLDIGRSVVAEEIEGEILPPESTNPIPDEIIEPITLLYEGYIPEGDQVHTAA